MTERVFVDSNVLVYAYDRSSGEKHRLAAGLIQQLWPEKEGVLSPQVLQEFYVAVTRKIPVPLPKETAREIVSLYAAWAVQISAADVLAAFRIEDDARISFWDALIVASAVRGGAGRIVTEDLNSGQMIAGVRIENPFVRN